MKRTASERMSRDLATRFRRLEPLLAANLDASGRVLNYPFLADLASWLVQAARERGPAAADVPAILDFLETAYSTGSFEIRNLISIGFVQMLPSTGEPSADFCDLLGPLLRADYGKVNW